MMDALANGRRIKCLTDRRRFHPGMPGHRCRLTASLVITFARVLESNRPISRATSSAIRTDQGPEFTSRALDRWAYSCGVDLKLIAAGKPTQNAYIESFNGKFRDECLNDHYFNNLAHARAVIAERRRDYNEARPHSSIGRMPPA